MSNWTAERIATLKTLWKDGVSASVIAKRLGGVSKNAVIGKVHRVGLEKRKSRCNIIRMPSQRPRQRWSKPQMSAPPVSSEPLPPALPVPSTALRLTLMQLTDQTCKCGLGDPKHADFAFCGLPVKLGSRYCPEHHAVIYSTVRTENAKKKVPRPRTVVAESRFERWAA